MNRNRFTRQFELLGVLLLLVCSGCDSSAPPPPTLEKLADILSVSFPEDCRVIGGADASGSGLWLIVSSEPLPLPEEDDVPPGPYGARSKERPPGTPFPVSSLANLIAACEVAPADVPRLTGQRGVSRIGQVGDWQYSYREAETERGWLTAVELFSTQTSAAQGATD